MDELYPLPPDPHFELDHFTTKAMQDRVQFLRQLNARHQKGWSLVAVIPMPVTSGAAAVVSGNVYFLWERADSA